MIAAGTHIDWRARRTREQVAVLKIPHMRKPTHIAKLIRDQLEIMIERLPGARPKQLYYVYNDDGEPEPDFDFCRLHALKRMDALKASTGLDHWIAQGWADSDSIRLCETCGHPLIAGGFTTDGIDSAIGLTEENPLRVHVYPAELIMAAQAMALEDPRWALWEHHARQLLAATYRKRKRQRSRRHA